MNDLELDLLNKLSLFLNNDNNITINEINKIKKLNINDKHALKLLLDDYFKDVKLYELYFDNIFNELNSKDYIIDSYYKNIKISNKKYSNWSIKLDKYRPYELFVYDDFNIKDNYVLPKIGYFTKPFYYLAIYENNNLWMSITPNEINTMRKPIDKAFGNVLTFGLGLGYFSYMVSNKENVKSVTIVETDNKVIDLFKKMIFPFFKFKYKINIINIDGYEYIKNIKDKEYDYIFVDIYHDVSDGKKVYNDFSKYTNKLKETIVDYWIYDSIKYYL